MTLSAHARLLRFGLAAFLLAGSGAAPAPAQAESMFGMFSSDFGPPSVAASVMRQGYVVRSAIVRRGDAYVCDASDPSGVMERLVIDSRTGRIVQRYGFRALAYAAEPHRFAPAVGGGGLFTSPPRPYVDVPQVRPQAEEAYPDFAEPPQIHHRQLVYGAGRDPLSSPPVPEPKPIERFKVKTARPKHNWTAAPSAPSAKPSETAAVPASDPTPVGATTASEPAKPPAAAPAVGDSAKPVAVAPVKSEGVVASSGPAESAPAPQPAAAAPVPPVAPARSKPKAINDIPVAPLD